MKEAETYALFSFQDKQLFDDVCLIEFGAEIESESRENDVACLLNATNISQEAK